MPVEPPRRHKLADIIGEDIKREIVTARLQPGDRLPNEKALMTHYGCAKATIRETLKVLEVEGLITLKTGPGGGAFIKAPTTDPASRALRNFLHFQHLDGSQVYQLRRLAEVEMAVSVIGRLSAEDFAALEANIERCRQPHAGDEGHRHHRMLELEFHNIMARACPNPLLRFLCGFLNDLLRDLVVLKKAYKPERKQFDQANIDYHVELVAALRQQDALRVRELMHDHMCDAEHHMTALEGQVADQFLVTPRHGLLTPG